MRNIVTLDALDKKIVAALQQDASLTNAELAQRVGSTGPSCWRRIKVLEEAGLLKNSVRLVDQELIGQGVNVLCHIRMKDHAVAIRSAFEAFVDSEPRIMECYSMSGEWDYLMRIVAEDVAAYESFLMRTLLNHPSVAGASSHFALRLTKYQTALPV